MGSFHFHRVLNSHAFLCVTIVQAQNALDFDGRDAAHDTARTLCIQCVLRCLRFETECDCLCVLRVSTLQYCLKLCENTVHPLCLTDVVAAGLLTRTATHHLDSQPLLILSCCFIAVRVDALFERSEITVIHF